MGRYRKEAKPEPRSLQDRGAYDRLLQALCKAETLDVLLEVSASQVYSPGERFAVVQNKGIFQVALSQSQVFFTTKRCEQKRTSVTEGQMMVSEGAGQQAGRY